MLRVERLLSTSSGQAFTHLWFWLSSLQKWQTISFLIKKFVCISLERERKKWCTKKKGEWVSEWESREERVGQRLVVGRQGRENHWSHTCQLQPSKWLYWRCCGDCRTTTPLPLSLSLTSFLLLTFFACTGISLSLYTHLCYILFYYLTVFHFIIVK